MVTQKLPPVRSAADLSLSSELDQIVEVIADARQFYDAVDAFLGVWNRQAAHLSDAAFQRELDALFELASARRARLVELSQEIEAGHLRTSADELEARVLKPLSLVRRDFDSLLIASPAEILAWRRAPQSGEYQELRHG